MTNRLSLEIREEMAREQNRRRYGMKKPGYPVWYKIAVYGLYAVIAVSIVWLAATVANTRAEETKITFERESVIMYPIYEN